MTIETPVPTKHRRAPRLGRAGRGAHAAATPSTGATAPRRSTTRCARSSWTRARSSASTTPSGRTPTSPALTRATSRASRTARSSAPSARRDAGPTNHWRDPAKMRELLDEKFAGACAGARCTSCRSRMGPLGSPIAEIGVQLTDSAYVAVSMRIMTRMGKGALDVLGDDGDFVPCLHTVGAPLAAGRDVERLAVQRGEVHRPLPRDARDLVLRLRLRRQRAARQEVLRPAHRRRSSPATRAGWPSTC